jgi:hypothetical protein
VRNNKQGNIGFLRMRNRVCVMLSRAKHGMYILGNRETLLANPGTPPMWPEVCCTPCACMGSSEILWVLGHSRKDL